MKKINIVMLLVITLSVITFLISCDNSSGSPGPEPVVFPDALLYTEWEHTEKDCIAYTHSNQVRLFDRTISTKKFNLQSKQEVKDINQTTFFFSSDLTKDFIVYRDGVVHTVSLGIVQKTGGWTLTNDDVRSDPWWYR
jgi:hypothetical protein